MTAVVEGRAATVLRRSQLFVPAHVDRYVAKAAGARSDAVILDLEDAVPPAEREGARRGLGAQVDRLASVPLVVVRVNPGADLERDLAACQAAGVAEVILPKVESALDIQRFDQMCGDLRYGPRLAVLVESARGLTHVHEILAAGRAVTVGLGAEDLRAEAELHAPSPGTSDVLMHAHVTLILAALSAGVMPIGLLGSIAQYRDRAALAREAEASWRLGYRGSYCIHPHQIGVLNDGFRPSRRDVAWADRVVDGDATARAKGRGAFVVDGAMVDAPLVARARQILDYDRLAQ